MNRLPLVLLVVVLLAVGWLLLDSWVGSPLEMINAEQVVEVTEDATAVRVVFEFVANSDVSITHVESSCDCATFTQLPIDLVAGQTAQIQADIDLAKIKKIPTRRQFLFYTNPPIGRPLGTIELVYVEGRN